MTNLNLSHINACSIVNKIDPYQMELTNSNIDVCAITETWLKTDDVLKAKMVPPPNYNIYSMPRTTGKWGWFDHGLQKPYNCYKGNYNTETMECSEYPLKMAQLSINLYVMYCIPSSCILTFCNDLANLIKLNIAKGRGKLLLGDFHIHLD